MERTTPGGRKGPSEEDCLAEIARLRWEGRPCPACDSREGLHPAAGRHRAFACRSCGMRVFPCQNTPFSKPTPPLTAWFGAAALASGRRRIGPRRLRHALRLDPRDARQIAAELDGLRKARIHADREETWFDALARFAPAGTPAAVAGRPERETMWDTLRSALPLSDMASRPLVSLGAIVGLALVGAGIGWLLVPPPPEPDTELQQATAVLSLAGDRPVILVTADVAEQLYDVQDVDEDKGNAAPTPSIRVVDSAEPSRLPSTLSDAKAITPPAVKLSSGVSQALLQGDVSAARAKAESRPELAAYGALARELEGSGPRNPDELLVFGPMKIRRHLVEKIVRAGRATQTDPVLLMAIADKESAFQTEVQAQTSSATGLFQFIERTWLGVVREFGPRYGLAREAALVTSSDLAGEERTRILALRRDAYLSAIMAAEMLKRDALRLQAKFGRPLTGGEVYLIHFLGPAGAERMLEQIGRKPDTVAAELLPQPAAANRPIFYGNDANGGTKSLSVSEVRNKFETMMSVRLDRYRTVKAPQAASAAPAGKPARAEASR